MNLRWTSKHQELLRQHYGPLARQPWPTVMLATQLGISPAAVRSRARHCLLTLRRFCRIDPHRVRQLRQRGLSDKKIAMQLDCSWQGVLGVRQRWSIA